MKNSHLFLIFLLVFFSFSCSLHYMEGENSEGSIPEFSFKNARYTKYEANKKNISLVAGQLEQYKVDNKIFAKDVSFEAFGSDGETETSGECQLLAANTKKENYTLFGNIQLFLPKQEMQIFAASLNFNKRNEQLVSASDSEVVLKKKDVSLSGYGFSASGVSRAFSFSGAVSGVIHSDDGDSSDEN